MNSASPSSVATLAKRAAHALLNFWAIAVILLLWEAMVLLNNCWRPVCVLRSSSARFRASMSSITPIKD